MSERAIDNVYFSKLFNRPKKHQKPNANKKLLNDIMAYKYEERGPNSRRAESEIIDFSTFGQLFSLSLFTNTHTYPHTHIHSFGCVWRVVALLNTRSVLTILGLERRGRLDGGQTKTE